MRMNLDLFELIRIVVVPNPSISGCRNSNHVEKPPTTVVENELGLLDYRLVLHRTLECDKRNTVNPSSNTVDDYGGLLGVGW